MKTVHTIALILVIVGAINWGLVGLADFNLVAAIFGEDSAAANVIYVLVALAGLWAISFFGLLARRETVGPMAAES